jgi:hypothetical protein
VLHHSCQVPRHPHAERGHDLYETPGVRDELVGQLERRISAVAAALRRDAPTLLAPGRPVKGSQLRSHSLKRGANRAYVLARLRRDGRADLIEKVESGALSVRGALAAMTDKQSSGQ